MKATNTLIIYIYNSRHVFASHALNMSGYFDQSARSLESRSMVIQLQRPGIYRQAARSVRIFWDSSIACMTMSHSHWKFYYIF